MDSSACFDKNVQISSLYCSFTIFYSFPVRGKLLFPWARKFALIAEHWLVPGTDSSVFI